MPELEKLEQFNQELIKSGDEPAVSLKRGEEIERVLTPEEYPLDHGVPKVRTNAPADGAAPGTDAPAKSETDDFLSQLAGDGEPEASPPPPADGGFDDLFDSDILSSLPGSAMPAEEPAGEAAGGEAETPGMADFGFDDLFGETGETGETGAAAEELGEAADLPESPAAPTDSGDSPDFGDLGELGDIGASESPVEPGDLADLSDLGEVPDAEAETVGAAEDFGSDFGADFADIGADMGEAPAAEAVEDAAGVPDFGMDAIPDFATDMSSEFGSDDFADEFNMGDFGKDFGVMEEVAEVAPQPGEAKHSVMEEVDEVIAKANAADEAEAFELSAAEFKQIQENLAGMPRNLKIAVEEAVSDPKYTFDIIHPLINGMIKGESPKEIANLLARVTGKRIKIPAGYTRKTGLAFEAEQASFAYQFRENFLPVMRIVALVAVAAGLLIFAAYQWVYRPLYGNSLYDQGLAAIHHEEYVQGNGLFEKAYQVWPDNDRYLQYARAFRDMKQWGYARAKYMELLGMPEPREKPLGKDRLHRQGIIDFADFAAYTLRDYDSAVNYLDRLLSVNRHDHVPAVMEGDIFIEWARYTGHHDKLSPSDKVRRIIMAAWENKGSSEEAVLTGPAGLYSAARFDYAVLIEKEGQTDALLSRMLRYFMRLGHYNEEQAELAGEEARHLQAIGDYKGQEKQAAAQRAFNRRAVELEEETEKIKKIFLADAKSKPDPAVIAELSGYLIDRSEGKIDYLEEPFKLLMQAEKSGKEGESEPGIHYQLARYYRALRNQERETKTLKRAKHYLEEREKDRPLDRFELMQLIDILISQGEIAWGPRYDGSDSINAQLLFEKARELYETGLRTRMLRERSSLFGRLYARLGDLKYYLSSEYETALRQYKLARQNQYGLPPEEIKLGEPRLAKDELIAGAQDLAYKSGYIWYILGNRLPEASSEKGAYFNEAAREFITAQGAIPIGNTSLDWAVANTSYLRANYETAAAIYRVLADRVEQERRRLSAVIPEEDFRQRDLVEFLIRINNNLGVSLYHLARQGGRTGSQYLAQAQYHTSRATELYQGISHEPLADSFNDQALVAQHYGLPLLNLQAMVNPSKADVTEIFRELRLDLTSTGFGRSLTEGGPGR
jgi:hypothetical protein